ncbi:hypothetical protein FQV37_775 [Psychrobacter nivimaris]|uniref:Uncharacterized protein n=1 Tax=Psychrobacter nivimaris TaxID=281738 RepID=A0A6N7C1Q1_9GAMM|nr:hypothetical protein [Psychrobacter nivimaris]KAF0568717.1 hypothetical protein FQV37_775 [Psychrobacter nivimaris]|tara:strand:- start:1243 stop:1899 length:657 start_codon:yes stop_codon:yes gene_type:complete
MSRSTLPLLDSSLYPQVWQQQTFTSPQALLLSMLFATLSRDITIDASAFTKQLLADDVYQEWINTTVFGRYLHRNFTAFYQQTEDSFNTDMPALFRQELVRHAQYLPLDQVLFFAGDMPKSVRQTKTLTTTVNPATAIINAQTLTVNTSKLIINQITITDKQVLGFAIRHNKRTSERLRNEVLILDFQDLRLVNEQAIEDIKKSNIDDSILLRSYEIR